jgi:hypothetical protein
MAWVELAGTRREANKNPNIVDYTMVMTAPTGETPPTNGDTIGTVKGTGDTLPSTGLAYEPELAYFEIQTKFSTLKDHMTCVFRGYYTA